MINYDAPQEHDGSNLDQTNKHPDPNIIQRIRNHAIALLATAGLLFGIKAYQERNSVPPLELPPTPTQFHALSEGEPITIDGHEFLWVRNDPSDETPIEQLTADQVHLVMIEKETADSNEYYTIPVSPDGTPLPKGEDIVPATEALIGGENTDAPTNDPNLGDVTSAS